MRYGKVGIGFCALLGAALLACHSSDRVPAVSDTNPDRRLSAFSEFSEGVNYRRVPAGNSTPHPAAGVEVIEFFSYGCIHCKTTDPYLESWARRAKPPYVRFYRVPVIWDAPTRLQAQAYYTAASVGAIEALHRPAFDEPLLGLADVKAFFAAHGIKDQTFTEAFASTAVATDLRQALSLVTTYHIYSVPAVMVDRKYLTDLDMAGSPQALVKLIDELVLAEAPQNSAAASARQ